MPPPPPPEFAEHKLETPAPPEIPLPETAASFDLPPIPDDLEWDWRLDALGVTIEPADVKPDQPFWHLVRADYQGPGESNGGHDILFVVVDQQNRPMTFQKVVQASASHKIDAATNEEGLARIAMEKSFAPSEGERGAYTASVHGLPCDRVIGLGLPMNQRVNFVLTWKRSIATFFGAK